MVKIKSDKIIKRYFTRKEVAEIVGVQVHMIDYWIHEFKIEMKKNGKRNRQYSIQKINLFKSIKAMSEEGYAKRGIQKKLNILIKKSYGTNVEFIQPSGLGNCN